MPVKFIAEVSSNHARDLARAKRFIAAAAEAGADAVKFQLFKVDELFAPEILARSNEHRARKEWELPVKFLPELQRACGEHGLAFSCTPFYLKAVAELEPYVDFYKIASYELLWTDLLKEVGATGKPVVLSTGMSTMPEIRAAVANARQRRRARHHALALRFGLSDAAQGMQSRRHRNHAHGDRLADRLVGSHARARRDRARGVALGREHGGVPHRYRRAGRGISRRPLLAAARDCAGDRAHPQRRAGGRTLFESANRSRVAGSLVARRSFGWPPAIQANQRTMDARTRRRVIE